MPRSGASNSRQLCQGVVGQSPRSVPGVREDSTVSARESSVRRSTGSGWFVVSSEHPLSFSRVSDRHRVCPLESRVIVVYALPRLISATDIMVPGSFKSTAAVGPFTMSGFLSYCVLLLTLLLPGATEVWTAHVRAMDCGASCRCGANRVDPCCCEQKGDGEGCGCERGPMRPLRGPEAPTPSGPQLPDLARANPIVPSDEPAASAVELQPRMAIERPHDARTRTLSILLRTFLI